MHQRPRTRLNLQPRNAAQDASGHPVSVSTTKPLAHPKSTTTETAKGKFPYGNYDHYYGYRVHNQTVSADTSCIAVNGTRAPKYGWEDPRLAFMDRQWFKGKEVLDIGCNSGLITIAIGKHFRPRSILGIDLDHGLIQKAKILLGFQASLVTPQRPLQTATWNHLPLDFEHPRIPGEMEGDQSTVIQSPEHMMDEHYFPISMPLLFGSVPVNRITAEEAIKHRLQPNFDQFPENIEFFTRNIMESDNWIKSNRGRFDTICALSLSKWVHIHYGDEGLIRFFRICFDLLKSNTSTSMDEDGENEMEPSGGVLILEPQPQSSYQRSLKFKPEGVGELQLNPDDDSLENVNSFWSVLISQIGFRVGHVVKAAEPEADEGFRRRPIWIFRK